MQKIIDLTHTITGDMPVYPGTEKPKLEEITTYEKDGFKETLLTLYSHTGTHMDAPAHIFDSRTTLDEFFVSQFVGPALVIDCKDLKEGEKIGIERIEKVSHKAGKAKFLLFNTGWDKKWNTPEYFGDYPCITPEVVKYLLDNDKKGIGLDTIGLDPIADTELTLHKMLFDKGEIVVIENLTGLDKLGDDIFTLCALPLKFEDSDGAPIRAVAILP